MERETGKKNDLEDRLFSFSLRVIRLYQKLAKGSELGRILGKQLLRSGTSIGANYQEGQAGQSRSDFISKTSIALKEARETHYWLRLVVGSDLQPTELMADHLSESEQIKKILGAIVSRCKRKGVAAVVKSRKEKGKSEPGDGT